MIARLFRRGKKAAGAPPVCTYRTAQPGLRIAVVGLGNQGRKLAAWAAAMGYEIAAGCDPSPEARAAFAQRFPAVPCLTDLAGLRGADFDLCVIGTLSNTHLPLLRAARDAGFTRILCEKPAADTVAACHAIRALAAQPGLAIAINHPHAWSDDIRAVRAALAAETFGAIRSVRVIFKPKGFGNIGCHQLVAVIGATGLTLTGARAAGFDTSRSFSRSPGFTDFNGWAEFTTAESIPVTLDNRPGHAGAPATVAVTCAHGRIDWSDDRQQRKHVDFRAPREDEWSYQHPFVAGPASLDARCALLDRALQDLVRDPAAARRTVDAACLAVEAIIAAQHAFRTRTAVSLPLPVDQPTPFPFS